MNATLQPAASLRVCTHQHQSARHESVTVEIILSGRFASQVCRPVYSAGLAIDLPEEAVTRTDVNFVACDRRCVCDSATRFNLPKDFRLEHCHVRLYWELWQE